MRVLLWAFLNRSEWIVELRNVCMSSNADSSFDPSTTTCLICGSEHLNRFQAKAFDSLTPAQVDIVECADCTFAWQFPLVRTAEQSVEHFEDAYTDQGENKSEYFEPEKKKKIAKLEMAFLGELNVQDKTLLDIGAGAGTFSAVAASEGWEVTAVDPAIDAKRLLDYPSVTVIKGSTDQIEVGKMFDVVVLWDVIEHVPNPLGFIDDIKKFVKPGGWIVLETGNYKGADRVMGGNEHWIYQLDHRWYFAPESLRHLIQKAGFVDLRFANRVFRPGWKGKEGFDGPSCGSLVKSILRDPLHLSSHYQRYSELVKAKDWEQSGLGIFTLAARKA